MIAAAAWVSTTAQEALSKAEAEPGKIPGLIDYLIKQRHGTPFEKGYLEVVVHAPIFVWREWHRHRIGFSYNEESARYKQLDPVFYLPTKDRPMFKVDDWKPGRPKFLTIEQEMERVLSTKSSEEWRAHGAMTDKQAPSKRYEKLVYNLTKSYELAYASYEENLAMGFDPGLARDCLPVAIYSSCWVSMNPRSIMSFLSLRVHEPTATFPSYPLWEIDNAARQLEEIFAKHWPITHEAFVKHGRVAP